MPLSIITWAMGLFGLYASVIGVALVLMAR